DVLAHVVAWLRHLTDVPDIHPGAIPDARQLLGEDPGIGVQRAVHPVVLDQLRVVGPRRRCGGIGHGGGHASTLFSRSSVVVTSCFCAHRTSRNFCTLPVGVVGKSLAARKSTRLGTLNRASFSLHNAITSSAVI